jgi:hypothetical protein
VPDGFWFVAFMIAGLIAASEWARRFVIRGMRSPPLAPRDDLRERRGRTRAPSVHATRGARVALLRPALPRNEVVAVPQWQKDP